MTDVAAEAMATPGSGHPTGRSDGEDGLDEEFFAALARADEQAAVARALRLIDEGSGAESVLLDLVAPAQRRVGELWLTGDWSAAREHAATYINEQVVGAVGARTHIPPGEERGHVVTACLDGEWHALPARLVSEVLRLRGWRVSFLGASVPAEQLVSHLHLHGPDVVAISCALPIHLPSGHHTVAAAQRTGTPVLAGGPGFGEGGRWAHALGIRTWAASAAEAADLLDTLPWSGDDPHRTESSRAPAGVNATEHADLLARRAQLAGVVARCLSRFGEAGEEDESTLLVDFLAAAVYVRDPDLFTDHVCWLAGMLAARELSEEPVLAALDTLRAELHDFPCAHECLDGGRLAVGGERAGGG